MKIKNNLSYEITKIVAKTLKIDISKINKNSSLGSIKEWDSLMHLNIFFALKKKYSKIDLEASSGVRSVKDWIRIIEKKYND